MASRDSGRSGGSERGPVAQRVARRLLAPPAKLLWPMRLHGYDAVPIDGPAILCANHLSFIDSVVLMLTLDRPVHFVGKAEYLDSWRTRHLFPAMGMIPIDRNNGARAMVALDAAAGVLARGGLLGVFPEGTRSRDGLLHKGYTGAARLAVAAGCPILPVGITGTDQIQPPGARLPRPRKRCTVSIGSQIPAPSAEAGGDRAGVRALTDHVMHEIGVLSGQTYVARYAPRSAPRAKPPRRQVRWSPRRLVHA
jgi:1-acyl-sn-glycerol-3-phosphate acyltransferase